MINNEGINVYIEAADGAKIFKENVIPGHFDSANTMRRQIDLELKREFRLIVKIPPNLEWPAPQMRISRVLADTRMWYTLAPRASESAYTVPIISEIGTYSVKFGENLGQQSTCLLRFSSIFL